MVALCGVILWGMQYTGGAWTAEFDGYPDESAQFVTGRMVWEYMRDLPRENPVSWAGQYYLHYPKVAMGHWPPLYHILEALWSLVFGSSRISAMWLQWLLGLLSLTALYQLARPRLPLAITCGIVLFAMATPVFQRGLEQTMSELCLLFFSLLFLGGMVRLVETSDASFSLLLFSFLAAALTKGTAVCLLPVPVLALLAAGKRPKLPFSRLQIAVLGLTLVLCLLFFLSTTNVVYWGGMTASMPWPILSFFGLAGVGFPLLALAGCRREPLPIVSMSMIASAILVSTVVRAMNEPRHWIIVLPSLLLLAGCAVARLRLPIALLMLGAAALFFPWLRYRQTPAGYGDLLSQIHLPGRMLISSGRGGEGAWIAEVCLAERYPASLVARASKVLAQSGWNGENYRLLVHSPEEVRRRLDELAIDTVVVDAPFFPFPPDHQLLEETVGNGSGWRVCCRAKNLIAYYRLKPPAYPREPLALSAGPWRFQERIR